VRAEANDGIGAREHLRQPGQTAPALIKLRKGRSRQAFAGNQVFCSVRQAKKVFEIPVAQVFDFRPFRKDEPL